MHNVRHCLKSKGGQLWSIQPDALVFDALRFMAEKDIGALLVLDGEKLAGVFSERDYARKVILQGKSSRETLVREIMAIDVPTVTGDQSIEECMTLMTIKRTRHLPVLEGERVIGVISIGDAVKEYIEDKEFMIDQLGKYISGKS